MVKIIDKIVGVMIITQYKNRAIEIAKKRIAQHKSCFNYGRFGKHESIDAIMTIKGDTITIEVKR